MLATRILLIWEHPFLRDTVKALLGKAGVEIMADFNFPVSQEVIQSHSPSHILVESSSKKHQELMASLLDYEGITIIRLGLDDNQLQVIQRQDYAIHDPTDLLNWLNRKPDNQSI